MTSAIEQFVGRLNMRCAALFEVVQMGDLQTLRWTPLRVCGWRATYQSGIEACECGACAQETPASG